MEMSYKNKFVMCILHNNSIVKELANGQVNLPLGSEYSIRLRNKHNKRAICRLFIDGENVSGGGFIINAHSYVDIERPFNVDKKFKFVSLDSEEAHDFGKNGPNHDKIKGTIVAEFALEKEKLWINTGINYPYSPYSPKLSSPWDSYPWFQNIGGPLNGDYRDVYANSSSKGMPNTSRTYTNSVNSVSLNNISTQPVMSNVEYADSFTKYGATSKDLQDGATVEGSKSYQQFYSTYFEDDGKWTTLRLFLQGYEKSTMKVYKPKTTFEIVEPKPIHVDQELIDLETELAELKKLKLKKEIDALKAELV